MKNRIAEFRDRLMPYLRRESVLWILMIALGAAAWIWSHSSAPVAPVDHSQDVDRVDTLIPPGYVLIPIELKNASQLEGMTGGTLVADLYEAAPEGSTRGARLVGRRMKMIRAPLNPSVFAVLLRDQEAGKILSATGPFIAGLRPLDTEGHEIAATRSVPTVEYQ